jgi:hypothetical protein
MKRPDSCIVHRTSTTTKTPLNRPEKTINDYGPYSCRVGKATSTLTQVSELPQIKFQSNLRLYLDVTANIQKGDIAEVTNKFGVVTKYTVQNAYRPGYHHTECDIVANEES